MPTWLQASLAVASLAVVLSQIVARWGGLAQRQDADGRTLDDAAKAVQRHETTDATLAQSIASLASVVGKMDAKLDRALADISAQQVSHAEVRAEARADRDRLAKIEARLDATDARITRVDETQTSARHALRTEIQGWVSAGITDALEILRALAGGGDGGTRPRPARRGS